MKTYTIEQVLAALKSSYKIEGTSEGKSVANVTTPDAADRHSLIWIKSKFNNDGIAEKTPAEVIVCDHAMPVTDALLRTKCFIRVDDPKLAFIRIATELFGDSNESGIHPSAVIHGNAKIGQGVYIGPNTTVGEAEIGDGTVIKGNCYIGNRVRIGKKVFINPGVIIGSEGFGYSRNAEGTLEKFPHFGGVVIEDEVEIGANTCIDRGSLGDTVLKQGAKIDNLVHIAHNVVVGRNSLVIANAMVGGSTVIGDESWVAPSVSLMNGIRIGDKVTIGMAALVTKNIPDGETWTGVPAYPIEKYLAMQKKIKEL